MLGDERIPTDRFVHDYRAAFQRLQRSLGGIRVKGILREGPGTGSNGRESRDRTIEYYYAASDGFEKLGTVPGPEKKAEEFQFSRVIVLDPTEQGFVLRSNHAGDPFYLESIPAPTAFQRDLRRVKGKFLGPILGFNSYRILDVLESKESQIKRISHFQHQGEDLIKVEFEHVSPSGAREGRPPSKTTNGTKERGWFAVDPLRTMALREYDVFAETLVKPSSDAKPMSARLKGSVRYSSQTGLPIPEVIITEIEYVNRGATRAEFHVEQWDYEATPQREFTLAAYGLDMARRPSGRWWYTAPFWAVVVAVTALAASILLRRFARRGEARMPESPALPSAALADDGR